MVAKASINLYKFCSLKGHSIKLQFFFLQ